MEILSYGTHRAVLHGLAVLYPQLFQGLATRIFVWMTAPLFLILRFCRARVWLRKHTCHALVVNNKR
jgi:hypothetical protein